MFTHQDRVKRATESIDSVFTDTSVQLTQTLESLTSLKQQLDEDIASVTDDIRLSGEEKAPETPPGPPVVQTDMMVPSSETAEHREQE